MAPQQAGMVTQQPDMVPQQGGYYPPAPLPAYPHPNFPPSVGPGFPSQPQCVPLQLGIPVAGHPVNTLHPYSSLTQPQSLPNSSTPALMGNMPGPVMGQAVLPYATPTPNPMNGLQATGANSVSVVPGQSAPNGHPPNSYNPVCHHPNSYNPCTTPTLNPIYGLQATGANNVSVAPGQPASNGHLPTSYNPACHHPNSYNPYATPTPNPMNGMQTGANNVSVAHGQPASNGHPPNSYNPACHHPNPTAPWQGQPRSSTPPSHASYPTFASCLQPPISRQNFMPAGPGVPNQPPYPQTPYPGFPQQEHAGPYAHLPPTAVPNGSQPNVQFCDANGTAIGLPVIGTPVYKDGAHVRPSIPFQGQQHGQPWQQMHSESPAPTEPSPQTPQTSKSTFVLTKYYRGSYLHSLPVSDADTQSCANGGQPPSIQRGDKQQPVLLNENLRSGGAYPCSAMEWNASVYPSRSQEQGVRREENQINGAYLQVGRREECQISGTCLQQESQSSSVDQGRKTFSDLNRGHGDYKGNDPSKGKGRRSADGRSYRRLSCDPCDRTFGNVEQLNAHTSTHVKCDEEGCKFEASGKMIKEHKLVEHGKTIAPTTLVGRRALALRSKESEEEIRRWREERKKNYPTSANLLRKVEEMKEKKGRGDLFDEDAQKRCERLREVIAMQKQLGIPVAEIPAHYFSTGHHKRQKPHRINRSVEADERETDKRVTLLGDGRAGRDSPQRLDFARSKRPLLPEDGPHISQEMADKKFITMTTMQEEYSPKASKVGDESRAQNDAHVVIDKSSIQNDTDTVIDKSITQDNTLTDVNNISTMSQVNGQGRKGSRNQSLRKRKRKRQYNDFDSTFERQPSLLSKLLEPDIQKDKSHLLQCCRFIINNSFFEGWPTNPLMFFGWVQTELPHSVDGLTDDKMHTLMLLDSQDSPNGKEVQDPFTWKLKNSDITKYCDEPALDELVPKLNDSMVDNDDADIFQYMNLDLSGTDSGI